MADAVTPIYGLTLPEVNVSTTWPTSLNGDATLLEGLIARPKIPPSSPTVGATTTCDLSLANVFVFTVSQATTLAFSNVPSASFAVFVDLLVTNGSAFVLTFPAAVTWLQGVAPSLQASGVDRIRMVTKDAGVTWYAIHLGKNLSLSGTFKSGYGSAAAQAKSAQVPAVLTGTTGATVESSVVSFSIPASSLVNATDLVRVKLYGNAVTQAAQLRVKYGASYVVNIAGGNNITAGNVFEVEAVIRRTGAATEVSVGRVIQGAAVIAPERATPAETLSGAVLLDIRGNTAVGGGVLNVDVATVEYLSQ